MTSNTTRKPGKPYRSRKDQQVWHCDVIQGGTRIARFASPSDIDVMQYAKSFAELPELEKSHAELLEALYESWALITNIVSDAEPEFLEYYSEYREVLKMGKKLLDKFGKI